jgi:NADPH:quinone reductase-like Zn-dependent oxidoreductase
VDARYGRSPFPPKAPFTPGYAIVGDVDAVGADATQAKAGERAAALTVYGGYAEYVYLAERS